MKADLIIRNARVLGRVALVDIAIAGERIVRIDEGLNLNGRGIDANGRLVTPPLVDSHLHLDGSLTAGTPRYNESGTLVEGIEIWREAKASLTRADVVRRGRDVVKWAVSNGTGHIRTHVDVSGGNDALLHGVLALRDEVAEWVDIQVVAFPQDGIYGDPSDGERLESALRLGADCVGGIPHYEATTSLGTQEIRRVFELAKKYGKCVDIHCDETDDPHSRFLEIIADQTLDENFHGKVTASHCTAMGSYEPVYSRKIHEVLRTADINIVVNPYSNALLQGRTTSYPKRRGFAQVKELLTAGVNVSLGNDVIMDPWYVMGNADMVDAAWLGLHFCHMAGLHEIEEMFHAVSTRGARTLGVEDEHGIDVGKRANLVIFDASTILEVMRLRAARRFVIRRGRVIAETTPGESWIMASTGKEPVTREVHATADAPGDVISSAGYGSAESQQVPRRLELHSSSMSRRSSK